MNRWFKYIVNSKIKEKWKTKKKNNQRVLCYLGIFNFKSLSYNVYNFM